MTDQYAVLAEYYDRLMCDTDYTAWAGFYGECFQKYGVSPTKILDLACGTGNITLPLAKMGYAMTGIDCSAEMLALARKKADDSGVFLCLSEQNIAMFDAGSLFDAAICSFDGINYLTKSADVLSCFAEVYNTLANGGLFIFDISTPYKYRELLADNAFVYEYDDLFVSWQNCFLEKSKLCHFYLTFFAKGKNGWQRYDEEQCQRAYSLSYIVKQLQKVGFTILETVSDINFSPLTETSDRAFFICRKGTPV